MKKILFCILASSLLFFSIVSYSQETKKSSIGVGVEYRTKKMDMEIAQFSPPLTDLDAKYQEFAIKQEYTLPMASVHLALMDNVDLAFLFGLMDYDLTQTSDLPGFGHDFSCDSTNAFGFSGKISLPLTESFLLGFFFEHFTSELDDVEFSSATPAMSFAIDGIPVVIESVSPENLKYHETTLTPIVALKWNRFMPYVGPRFTAAKADMDVTYMINGRELDRKIKYDPNESWSAVVGVIAMITDNLSITAEAEIMENESYKIGINYSF